MRYLVRLLATLLIAGSVLLPVAYAQPTSGREAATDEEKEVKVPALQYTVAFAITILILVVVCMPSRKAIQQQD